MASSFLGKSQIVANPTALADGDSIASYLVDSAGTLLTSTLVGAKQALDVNVAESVLPTGAATEATLASILADLQLLTNVDGAAWSAGSTGAMSLAVRKDAAGPFSGVADGDFSPLQVDANGALKISGSITVDAAGDYATGSAHGATDIGIYNLSVRRDVRAVDAGVDDGDYASFSVNNIGELWVHDQDVEDALALANASLDAIEADSAAILVELLDQGTTLDAILADTATIDSTLAGLSKAEDSAAVSGDAGIQALAVRKDASGSNVGADGDYASLQVWSNGELKVADIANGAILQQQVSVTSTAAALPASPLASRKSLLIQNTGGSKCWIGTSSVTTAGATAGIELAANSFLELEVGPAVAVYAIKNGAGGNNVNILEMA